MNRCMFFLSIHLLKSVNRERCDTTWALPVHYTLTIYLVRGHYVRGLYLFEDSGVEAVVGGACCRCLLKVYSSVDIEVVICSHGGGLSRGGILHAF